MLHQWSILFHGHSNGRLSIVRRRDIDPVAAGGGSDGTEPPVDATPDAPAAPDASLDVPQPDVEPVAPNLEDLFKDPEPAPDDPNAPAETAPAVPQEYQQALGISEYVKDATQLAGAVTLADQVIKVQNGEAPITGLLENFRAQNSPAFEKMARESLIPYVEQITGMKLMDPAKAGDQKTPEQQRIDAIEQRFQQQQQEQQQAARSAQVGRASSILTERAGQALKGTFLEGKEVKYLAQLAPHMGMDDQQAVQALLAGRTDIVDKAVKSLLAEKEAEGRAWARHAIAESKKLKTGLPAGKGNPRPPAAGELPDGATMEQKIAYLNQ